MTTAHLSLSVAPLVAQACADEFGVPVADLHGRRRYEPLATARGIAMFLLFVHCGFTGENAGRAVGRGQWNARYFARKIRGEIAMGDQLTIDRVQRIWARYQAMIKDVNCPA